MASVHPADDKEVFLPTNDGVQGVDKAFKPKAQVLTKQKTMMIQDDDPQVIEVRNQLARDKDYWKPGTPHIIGCSMQVHYIKQIDTVNQQFDAGFYLSYEFQPSQEDVRNWKAAKEAGEIADFVPKFIPSFRFPNAFDFIQRDHKPYLDGSIYSLLVNGEKDTRGALVDMDFDYIFASRLAIRGTFGEPLELQDFPFDCQELAINIASSAASTIQVLVPHFRRKKFVVISQEVSTFPEWICHAPVCDMKLSDVSNSARGLRFSNLVLILKFERISYAYLTRVYSQLALITATGFSMFAMDAAEDLADRLATAFTLLLTAVAFMFVIESKLPSVPYLTALDYYTIVSFVFLLFLAGYSALATSMVTLFDTTIEDLEDAICYAMFGIWILYHVFFIFSGIRKKKNNIQKLVVVRELAKKIDPIVVEHGGDNVPGIFWGVKPKSKQKQARDNQARQ